MNADYRVKEIFTDENTGDVIALCLDVLYGETFEKFLGQGDTFDGKENASNLLQDSNYEISDGIRADIEDIFGVKEFEDDQDYDGYQFYDFGDDEDEDIYVNIETKEEYTMSPTNDGRIRLYSLSDDSGRSDITISEDEFYKNYEYVESEEKIDDLVYAGNSNGVSTNESFNLREALNTIDLNTYNKYDLLNLYEACNLSENEKRALANIVYDQNDPSVIYDTLNDRFLGKEIEMPERVKDGVIHEEANESKSIKEDFYRGNKSVQFIGHGEWSDPELEYNGYLFSYWDIEDALWNDFLDETGYSDAQSDDPTVEKQFNKFVQDRATDYLDDCIYSGSFDNETLEEDTDAQGVIQRSDGKYLNLWDDTQIGFDEDKNKAIKDSPDKLKEICDWLNKCYNEFVTDGPYTFKITN